MRIFFTASPVLLEAGPMKENFKNKKINKDWEIKVAAKRNKKKKNVLTHTNKSNHIREKKRK